MKHPHRCNRCRQRFTLARPMTHYKRAPRCPGCHTTRIHYDTHKRAERLARKAAMPCHCDASHYPHRPGSLVQCRHAQDQAERAELISRIGLTA